MNEYNAVALEVLEAADMARIDLARGRALRPAVPIYHKPAAGIVPDCGCSVGNRPALWDTPDLVKACYTPAKKYACKTVNVLDYLKAKHPYLWQRYQVLSRDEQLDVLRYFHDEAEAWQDKRERRQRTAQARAAKRARSERIALAKKRTERQANETRRVG